MIPLRITNTPILLTLLQKLSLPEEQSVILFIPIPISTLSVRNIHPPNSSITQLILNSFSASAHPFHLTLKQGGYKYSQQSQRQIPSSTHLQLNLDSDPAATAGSLLHSRFLVLSTVLKDRLGLTTRTGTWIGCSAVGARGHWGSSGLSCARKRC